MIPPHTLAVARGIGLSAALHAPFVVWVGARMLAMTDPTNVSVYEVELLPEPPQPVDPPASETPPEPPIPPPEVARADAVPLPGDPSNDAVEPSAGPEAQRASGPPRPHGAPAAAQAGRVVTAPEAHGAESDPLDFTVVQGSASRYAGGVTAATGTSDKAVRDPGARGGHVAQQTPTRSGPGGAGRLAPPRATAGAKAPSKRRFARPVSESWNCAFPPEADANDVHYARVLVVVTVRADGSPSSAAVLSDPGFGFAAAARRCALGQRFAVAWDDAGRPSAGRTPPFTVTFTR